MAGFALRGKAQEETGAERRETKGKYRVCPSSGGSEASLTKESNCVQMSSRSHAGFLSLEISLLDSISWTVRRQ